MAAIQTGHTYKNISALAATTVIKSGPGTLIRVCINTKGGSSNVLTLYDNASAASGTKIATIDTTTNSATTTTTVVTPVPWERSCPPHNHYDAKTDACVF